uniref:retinol dehydrogenase 7-like n=1 Tax=Podarcis muralis TaxID=64176 RepID=UPI00109F634A|nr:retinol dehydrogenase 7-like [Podarcis muralis]
MERKNTTYEELLRKTEQGPKLKPYEEIKSLFMGWLQYHQVNDLLKEDKKNLGFEDKKSKFNVEVVEGLWGLVNNAGIGVPSGPNEWLTKDDFAKVINVNLLGLIDVTLHMLPLVRRARGRVVNVCSVNGRLACFGGGYCPSKFGVEAFSDTLRRELHPFGIKVSIVEPGSFKTPIQSKLAESYEPLWSRLPSDLKECYGRKYFEQCCKISEYFQKAGSDNLHLVTDCIEHALTSCSPRTRYSPGWDAKLFYLPVSYFPTSITDFVMSCIWPKPAQAI